MVELKKNKAEPYTDSALFIINLVIQLAKSILPNS